MLKNYLNGNKFFYSQKKTFEIRSNFKQYLALDKERERERMREKVRPFVG